MSQTQCASHLNQTAQFPLGVSQGDGSEPWGPARWSTFDASLKVTHGSGKTGNRVPKKTVEALTALVEPKPPDATPTISLICVKSAPAIAVATPAVLPLASQRYP